MNISRLFIMRPVATSLLMLALLLVGMVAYRFLPLSALPEVDYPTIQVQTFYPGASPEVMATSGDRAAGTAVRRNARAEQMSSNSSAGASVITLQFALDLTLDVAEQDVQAGDQCRRQPAAVRPARAADLRQSQSGRPPIITLAVTCHTMSLTQIAGPREETARARRSAEIDGVGLVSISGGHRPAVRVQADPQALAAFGLNIDDLRTTIGNLNVNRRKAISTGRRTTTPSMRTISCRTRRSMSAGDRLSQWRAGAPDGCGDHHSGDRKTTGAWL